MKTAEEVRKMTKDTRERLLKSIEKDIIAEAKDGKTCTEFYCDDSWGACKAVAEVLREHGYKVDLQDISEGCETSYWFTISWDDKGVEEIKPK